MRRYEVDNNHSKPKTPLKSSKFGRKDHANDSEKKIDPKNYPSLTIIKVKQSQVYLVNFLYQ